MSDARWIDVDIQIRNAVGHFSNAIAINQESEKSGKTEFTRSRDSYALRHALQVAHRSAEAAIEKILNLLGETPPTGENWQAALLDRAGLTIQAGEFSRTAIIPADMLEDLHETRRFRHTAMNSYDHFIPNKARPTLEAAERLVNQLPEAIAAFKASVDPDYDTNNDPQGGTGPSL